MINIRTGFVLLFGIVFISVLWNTWPRDNGAEFDVSNAFESGFCEQEAVLLSEKVDVYENPDQPSSLELRPGAAIYLCSSDGQFQKIVFPGPGGKADCSNREKSLCSHGYVRVPFDYEILG